MAAVFAPAPLCAQDDVTFQLWSVVDQAWQPRDKWQRGGDVGLRLDPGDPAAYTRVQLGGTMRYLFNGSLDGRGGLGLFYTFQHRPNQFEIRPYQGAQLVWPRIGNIDFRNLVRVEERVVLQEGSSPSFSLRFRYRIGTVIPIGRLIERVTGYNRVSVPLWAEFFSNPGGVQERYATTVRLGAGIAYIASLQWSGDATLIFEKSRDTASENFRTNSIMLRFDIRHNRPAIAQ